ncbi:hypothetical protein H8E77_17135 [bacterium]|nr:hypothetical protein [bacterium]
MSLFILYLVLGNAFLIFSILRVKEKIEQIQLLFLLLAVCLPPLLFTGTLGVMYLFHLDYFFDNDMLFLSSLSQIIVSVAFAYSLVMFDYIHTQERMAQQERLAFLGLMDAKLAHEIRSPIVIIRNLSNIMLSQLRSNQKEDALDLTTEIQQNADNTLALISAIRADLKQDKPKQAYYSIPKMVDEAVETTKRSTVKDISITIDPVNYIHKMKENHLLQLNTTQDTVFPLSCQKKLSLAFKKSNVKYRLSLFPFPCGHYSAGKYLLPKLYLLAKVFFFIRKNI